MAAAITHACSLYANRKEHTVSQLATETSLFFQLDINNNNCNTIGIKFDNISARKYFALIHTTQQYAAVNKATEKDDDLIQTDSHVTPKKNNLDSVFGRNEPLVLCQSTFL
jgi:hypothetical protein